MTSCTPTEVRGELEFVQALYRRVNTGACTGSLITLAMLPERVCQVERVFPNEIAGNVLWSGFENDEAGRLRFTLCAGHWFDLSCLLWARGWQQHRIDWLHQAELLLSDLCHEVGWDPKEIANLFTWSRVRLT